MDQDVIVVGAGLAGLQCADRLAASGLKVTVLEASDDVGGRQRTDEVDGFLLDRGFQVINPAYPALKRWVQLDELHLHPFGAGLNVRREASLVTLVHPLREPSAIPAMLGSGLLSPSDILGLVKWFGPTLVDARRTICGPDATRGQGLDAAGVRGRLRREVIEPFLAGVVAESTGETSDSFTKLLVRMFALGVPSLPAHGVQTLPTWLAAQAQGRDLPVTVQCEQEVREIHASESVTTVRTVAGESFQSRLVVVAVGPQHVARLLSIGRPRTRGLRTWWFSADEAPTSSTMLAVDGRRSAQRAAGPVVNAAVMSNAVPSYAPAGKHLIEASCLLDPARSHDGADEQVVRRQAGEMLSATAAPSSMNWELIRCDAIPNALPAQPAPLRTTTPAMVSPGLFVAGDHRDTASIQGAIVSGTRVAEAVVARLRGH